MDFKLNKQQMAAVMDDSPVCLVNANVGSGKTTVLASKVHYLHEEKKTALERMVVLTFTNKAAGEIRDRLNLGEDRRESRFFGTFHSVALTLLKEELPVGELGYDTTFLVMTPEEEAELAMGLIRREKLNIKYKNRLKKRLQRENPCKYGDDLDQLRKLLKDEKKAMNRMTFDDLIENATLLLEAHPMDFDWVIIDEIQDTDDSQLAMIRALVGPETHLFAVGDPNQVIYSWRGSRTNVFYRLRQDYPVKEMNLPVSYRSTGTILKAAGYFKTSGEGLNGEKAMGAPIHLHQQYDAFQDADRIAGRIQQLHEEGIAYKDMAVFYRLQNQSEVFEHVFRKEDIPYTVSVKKTVGDLPVLDFVVKLLKFAADPEDTGAGMAILRSKAYGMGLTEKKAEKRLKEELTPEEGQLMLDFGSSPKEDLLNLAVKLTERIGDRIPEAEEIYDLLQMDKVLKPNSASYKEDRQRVMTFFKGICRDMLDRRLPFAQNLREVLNQAALCGIGYVDEAYEEASDSVRLMTLHASKGLEFTVVFMTGANTGLMPLTGSGTDEDEERRLFFVGMTRARDLLELSYYTNPGQANIQPGPGKFIRSIPPKLLEGGEKDRGIANLQMLKREVQAEIKKKTPAKEEAKARCIRHEKYGVGEITSEDEMMLTARFEGYGEKTFIKAFTAIEYLS